ncbi:MAG: Ig-like domain-containing protein [Thermoplasmata archaeon]|nr:MAG: Ig-like domain-containing protein [Thermoplasmata archaeon]
MNTKTKENFLVKLRNKVCAVFLTVVLVGALLVPLGLIQEARAHSGDELLSPMTLTPPTLDGVFGPGEWNDASMADLTIIPNNMLGTYMYVMNNDTCLFVLYDVVGDTTDDPGDTAAMGFDTNHDGANGPADGDDDFFGVGSWFGGEQHYEWDSGMGDWQNHCSPFSDPDLSVTYGYGTSPNSGADHRIFEWCIPLSILDTAPGGIIGFAAGCQFAPGVADDSSGNLDQWPVNPMAPIPLSNYGDLIIGSQDGVNLKPEKQGMPGMPAQIITYSLNVTNTGLNPDLFDITYFSSMGWTVDLYDNTWNPLVDNGGSPDVDTGFLVPKSSFEIYVNVNIPPIANPGDTDVTTITATSLNNNSLSDSSVLKTSVPYQTNWMDGFESGWSSWSTEVLGSSNPFPTNWEIGDPMGSGPAAPYNGSNCIGTNIADDYYPGANICLLTPHVELDSSPQILSFYHWYEMDTMGDDGGFVEISVSGGPWTQIYPVDGYDQNGFMGGYNTDGFTGSHLAWEYEEFDLSAYLGQIVQIRLHFAASNWWGSQYGWYLDDVYIGDPPPYKCDLFPDYQTDYGYPASDVDYILTVDNTGSADDTYNLVSMSIWPVTFRDIGDTMDITTLFVASGNSEDFIARVAVDALANPGDFDIAYLNASSQNDPGTYDRAGLRTQVPYSADWFYDFAPGWDAWTEQAYSPGIGPTNWEIGDPMGWGPGSAYSGTNCAGTNIDDNYYEYADIMLVTPFVELGPSPQLLSFMHWYEMDTWEDEGGFVEIDDGGGWSQIYPLGGYPDWGMMGGYWTDGYTGISSGWEYAEFDLSAYANSVVQVRFHFASEDWGWQPGWYVDDIYLGGPPPYRCDLWPDYNMNYGYPAANSDHILTVDNTGANDDTYDLTAMSLWPVTFRDIGDTMDITSIFVFAGTSGDFIARVTVDALANPGDMDLAFVNASSQNDPGVYDVSMILTQVPYIVDWFDDFATGWGGWTQDVYDPGTPVPTYWQIGDPAGWGPGSAYSGTNCAGTNIDDDYYMYADIMLVSPYVELGASSQLLSFMHWYDMDTMEDEGGFVEIDDGGGWSQIYPVGGYPDSGMMGGYWTDGYTGISSGWEYAEFDLSAYSGSVVQVRFHFASWDWGWRSGWYVDDIYIGGPPSYRCELTPFYQGYYGYPTDNIDHVMTIDNTGSDDDTYDLSASMNLWPVTFRDISGGGAINDIFVSAGTSEDFIVRVQIPGGASPGDIDYANITATSQGDGSVFDYAYTGTQVPHDVNWLDGFEAGWFGWTPEVLVQSNPNPTNWEVGDPMGSGPGSAYMGTNCAGTNLVDDYYPNADICFDSPYVELGSGLQLLSFYHWYEMDTFDEDGGFVEISVNGGPWAQIYPMDGYPSTGGWMGGYFTDGYSGSTSGWEYDEFDVSGYANQVVQIRFHFAATDWWGGQWGWYIDDVYLGGPPPYRCDLMPDETGSPGYPSTNVDYYFMVNNTGSSDDTFDLTNNTAWPVTFRDFGDTMDITSVFVSAGTTEFIIARVTIPASAQPGEFDYGGITITSQNDPASNDTSSMFTMVPINAPFFDDIEGGGPMYPRYDMNVNPGTYWQEGDPSAFPGGPGGAYSASNCFGTNLLADYEWGADAFLLLPYMDLTTALSANFTFWHWYQIDGNFYGEFMDEDGGWLEISEDLGYSWSHFTPVGGYPDQTESSVPDYVGNVPCYASDSFGWQLAEFDLTSYCGQVIMLRFRFWSEPWNEPGWPGWYVDDFRLQATFPAVPWVIETIPVNDAIGIPESQNIVVIYSESMDTGVTPTLTQVGGPDPGGWTFSGWSTTYVADDTATWTHSDWTPGQAVNMSVSGGEDLDGNPQTAFLWNFTIDLSVTTALATGPISGPTNIAGIFITYTTTGGPASVDLYYTTDTSSPYTWTYINTDMPASGSYAWTLPLDGTYGWFAVSPDESAPLSTDAPEASSYIYDGTQPEVQSTDPLNGATDVPVDYDVVITFNETMIPGTFTYTIEPDPGGLSQVWSVGDSVCTISHNDFPMGERIWVNITAATDLVTNNLDPLPYSFYFDTAYTTATATGPISGPTNIAGITITYLTTGGPVSADLYYTTDTTAPYTWTYIDTDNPADGSYIWSVPIDGEYGWFAVSPDEAAPLTSDAPEASWYIYDATQPQVLSTDPVDTAVGVSVNKDVVITFNETMTPGTLTYTFEPNPGGLAQLWSGGDMIVTISHNNLALGTRYWVNITAATDLASNDLNPLPYSFYFDTANTAAIATGPVSGPTNVAAINILYNTIGGPATVDLYYTTDTTAPYTWTYIDTDNPADGTYAWTVPVDGTYGWYAQSPDESAPSTSDAPEASSYVYDATAPEVLITSPVSGATGIPVNQDVVITFNETMTPGSFAYTIEPNPGGLSEVWSVGDTVVTISHTDFTALTRYWVNITSASDLAGNPLSPLPYSFYFDTEVPDIIPPWIVSRNPIGGSVVVGTNIVITFNESMDVTSVQNAFSILPTISGLFSWNPANTILTFNPSSNLAYSTTYTITINSSIAKDLFGNYLDGNENGTQEGSPDDDYIWQFTTETLDTTPPTSYVSALPTYQTSLSFSVSYSASDAQSSVMEVELWFKKDSGGWSLYNTYSGGSRTITFTADSDGAYSFYTRARDTRSNYERAPSSSDAQTIVDTTPPVVDAGSDVYSNLQFTQDATASDVTSGIDTYEWTMISGPGLIIFGTPDMEDTTIRADDTGSTYVIRLTVTDYAGHSAYDEFTLEWDSKHPTVASVSPTGENMSIASTISVTFSEAMNQASVESAFSISPTVSGTYSWSSNTLTFTPSDDFSYDTQYSITIGTGAQDVMGNGLTAAYNWQFTTEAEIVIDTTSPTVDSVSLSGDEVRVTDEITITFSEPMNHTSVEDAISISPDVDIIDFTWKGNKLTITFETDLEHGTEYTITVGTDAKDEAGNSLDEPYTEQFTTEKAGSEEEETSAFWLIPLIIVIIVVLLLILFLMKNKKKPEDTLQGGMYGGAPAYQPQRPPQGGAPGESGAYQSGGSPQGNVPVEQGAGMPPHIEEPEPEVPEQETDEIANEEPEAPEQEIGEITNEEPEPESPEQETGEIANEEPEAPEHEASDIKENKKGKAKKKGK